MNPVSHCPSKPRNAAGFSMAEIVIALGIVATSMLALLALLSLVMGESRKSASRTIGSQISTRLMGEIQMLSWDDVDSYVADPSKQYRYFNEFGEELVSSVSTNPQGDSVYTAHIVMSPDPAMTAAGVIGMNTASVRPNAHVRQATVYVAAAPGTIGQQRITSAITNGANPADVLVQTSLITHLDK